MSSEVTGKGVLAFIEQSGQKVKADLLQLVKHELPELPKYDLIYQGFQSAFDRTYPTEFSQQERESGIKLYENLFDYTKPLKIVVLNHDGIFEIPIAKADGNPSLGLNYDEMHEVDPAEYIAFAGKAIDRINRWAEVTMQSNLVVSDNRVQQLA